MVKLEPVAEEVGLAAVVLLAAIVELLVGAEDTTGAVVGAGAIALVGCGVWAVTQPAVTSVMARKLSQERVVLFLNIIPLVIGFFEIKF